MALTTFKQDILSDLVAHEMAPYDGYARRVVNVTLAENTSIPMGTVVFRATNAVSQTAAYAPVTTANATTALVAGNEFAVVFGDRWKAQVEIEADASGTTPCVAFVRDEVQLKDHLLMANLGITDRTSATYLALKALLERQGIIIEKTLNSVPFSL